MGEDGWEVAHVGGIWLDKGKFGRGRMRMGGAEAKAGQGKVEVGERQGGAGQVQARQYTPGGDGGR